MKMLIHYKSIVLFCSFSTTTNDLLGIDINNIKIIFKKITIFKDISEITQNNCRLNA